MEQDQEGYIDDLTPGSLPLAHGGSLAPYHSDSSTGSVSSYSNTVQRQTFLAPLFKREDYLLGTTKSEQTILIEEIQTVDPKTLHLDWYRQSSGSPRDAHHGDSQPLSAP